MTVTKMRQPKLPERMDIFFTDVSTGATAEIEGWLFPDSVTLGLFEVFMKLKKKRDFKDLEIVIWYTGDDSYSLLGIDAKLPEKARTAFKSSFKLCSEYLGVESDVDPAEYSCQEPLMRYLNGRVEIFTGQEREVPESSQTEEQNSPYAQASDFDLEFVTVKQTA